MSSFELDFNLCQDPVSTHGPILRSQGLELPCIFFEGHNSPSDTEAREDGKPGSRAGEGELSVHAWVLRPGAKCERETELRDIGSCIGSNGNRCLKVRFSVWMVWLKL